MKTLNIDLKTAKSIYPTSKGEFKKSLEETFGIENLTSDPTKTIKEFSDALKLSESNLSDNMKIILDYNGQERDIISIQAYAKLIIIAKALNEGWEPDYTNSDEKKFFPYFDLSSGFAFSGTYYCYTLTDTNVGSRLVFKTRELAEYAGTQFLSIYKGYLGK